MLHKLSFLATLSVLHHVATADFRLGWYSGEQAVFSGGGGVVNDIGGAVYQHGAGKVYSSPCTFGASTPNSAYNYEQLACDRIKQIASPPTVHHGLFNNYCGVKGIASGCKSLELDKKGDCSKAASADYDKDRSSPPDGQFYADLIDTSQSNKVVGRCVYENGGTHDCSNLLGSSMAGLWVHCYTDACGGD